MRAASENLVPVTLELGGKSPVLVDVDADIKIVAERVLTSKTFNAGQICIAPDYALLPPSAREAFIEHARAFVAATYPDLEATPITPPLSTIGTSSACRCCSMTPRPREQPSSVLHRTAKQMPILRPACWQRLVLDPDDTMRVMQEEIFGPVLPLVNCPDLDHAIDYVNAIASAGRVLLRQRRNASKRFTERTTSGAAVINDTLIHAFIEDLPFGGIGLPASAPTTASMGSGVSATPRPW
jgi:coniferyl-aldehyde dehydrogenase